MWFQNKNQETNELALADLPIQRDWELVTRSYAPPRRELAGLNLSDTLAQKAVCGVTTYLWQDRNTGDLRKEELLGSDADELGELVDKVERLGMQYIKLNGNVYAIAKVPSETANAVPLK